MTRYILLGFLVSFVFVFAQARAQETSGGFSEGSILIGYDNRTCNGTLEGSIRYNSSILNTEFCDGTSWTSPTSCVPPAGCTAVGDVCTDGSQFAGFMIYNNATCEALFVTDDNQSTSSKFKTSSGTNDIATDSFVDGRANQAQVSPIASFLAFDLCETLNRHSKTDWYLPALGELNLLSENHVAIDAAPPVGAFTTGGYWSSSEAGTSSGWYQNISNSLNGVTVKSNPGGVRCVRRD